MLVTISETMNVREGLTLWAKPWACHLIRTCHANISYRDKVAGYGRASCAARSRSMSFCASCATASRSVLLSALTCPLFIMTIPFTDWIVTRDA